MNPTLTPAPCRPGWTVAIKEFEEGQVVEYRLEADGMSEPEATELAREWKRIAQSRPPEQGLDVEMFYVPKELADQRTAH